MNAFESLYHFVLYQTIIPIFFHFNLNTNSNWHLCFVFNLVLDVQSWLLLHVFTFIKK